MNTSQRIFKNLDEVTEYFNKTVSKKPVFYHNIECPEPESEFIKQFNKHETTPFDFKNSEEWDSNLVSIDKNVFDETKEILNDLVLSGNQIVISAPA